MRYRLVLEGREPYLFTASSKSEALTLAVNFLKKENFSSFFVIEKLCKKDFSWRPIVNRYGLKFYDISDFQ